MLKRLIGKKAAAPLEGVPFVKPEIGSAYSYFDVMLISTIRSL